MKTQYGQNKLISLKKIQTNDKESHSAKHTKLLKISYIALFHNYTHKKRERKYLFLKTL